MGIPSIISRSQFFALALWTTLLGSLGWLAWQIWMLRLPENAFTAYGEFDFDVARYIALIAGAVLIWRTKPPGWQFTLRNLMAGTLLVAFLFGSREIYERRGSLMLGFRQSGTELDTIADRFAASQSRVEAPVNLRAGWYEIKSGQRIGAAVFLRTSRYWPMTNSGYGFIRIPHGNQVTSRDLGLERAGFFHLGGDWYVVYDLYRKGKFGWS